ncbi:hypothetical protein [Sphingomonas asaccharolytica]|uniref:hypothetical protein n=1 Tax=Sphingomonas asaccharolytica TaxID=40681 RepID=UPI000ACCF932|nr:hypothetical protein [Sphingomonas asaccharolytica]
MATTFQSFDPPATASSDAHTEVRTALVPSWMEISTLALLNIVYFFALTLGGRILDIINLAGPSFLIIVLGVGAARMLRGSVNTLWTPFFWVRISSIAYFGVGSVVPYIVNDETRQALNSFYFTFPDDVAHYNLVTGLFILTVFVAFRAVSLLIAQQSRKAGTYLFNYVPEPCGIGNAPFAAICLGAGMIVRYLILLPHSFGLIESYVPAWLANVSQLALVGYYLGTLEMLRRRPALVFAIVVLALLDFATGLLEFSKTSAILPLIMIIIALVQHYRRLWVTGVLLAVIVATFFSIAPVVTYGRAMLGKINGTVFSGTLDQRVAILQSYSPAAADVEMNSDIQGGWARLSYVAAGSFVIDQYDAGRPGTTFKNAGFALIPRILYPEKPNITAVGTELSIAINGNETSQIAAGWPPELYWNGGWALVILGAVLIGALFAALSLYTMAVLRHNSVHLLLAVLMGLRMGTRMDGFVVPDVFGALPILIVAHLGLTFFNRLTFKRR